MDFPPNGFFPSLPIVLVTEKTILVFFFFYIYIILLTDRQTNKIIGFHTEYDFVFYRILKDFTNKKKKGRRGPRSLAVAGIKINLNTEEKHMQKQECMCVTTVFSFMDLQSGCQGDPAHLVRPPASHPEPPTVRLFLPRLLPEVLAWFTEALYKRIINMISNVVFFWESVSPLLVDKCVTVNSPVATQTLQVLWDVSLL